MAVQPKPLSDFVARFTKPGAHMLARVYRAESIEIATEYALDATALYGTLSGWRLLDLVTFDASLERSRGLR